MKHFNFLSIMLLVYCVMVSCSQSSRLESAAKKQMKATLKEEATDLANLKFSNLKTVFCDDSLCIIHVDITLKNLLDMELKHRSEYIFIRSHGKNYEAYQGIDNEEAGIFISPEKYDKTKKGTIYESLPYESGMRYLAVRYVNSNGREAGVHDGEKFSIPVPTGTGSWLLKSYKDEFGGESANKYLALMGSGVFSNSATTDSEMTACLFIDKDYSFTFKLIEYNSNVVKSDDSYDYRIKDSIGEVYEMTLYNSDESGQMNSLISEDKETMKNILEKGGIIIISVRERRSSRYSAPDTYLFKMDVTGFEKAMSYLLDTK